MKFVNPKGRKFLHNWYSLLGRPLATKMRRAQPAL